MDGRYRAELSKDAKQQVEKLKRSGRHAYLRKVFVFLAEVEGDPRTGTGHPKPLTGHGGDVWARKVNGKDRFVYTILEEEGVVFVTQVLGHYGDR